MYVQTASLAMYEARQAKQRTSEQLVGWRRNPKGHLGRRGRCCLAGVGVSADISHLFLSSDDIHLFHKVCARHIRPSKGTLGDLWLTYINREQTEQNGNFTSRIRSWHSNFLGINLRQ